MDDLGFELLASSLRADTTDLVAFTEVLASKLEGALPSQTVVQRKSAGFLSRNKRVSSISVDMGDQRFDLLANGSRLEPRLSKVVRNIVLKSDVVPLDLWIDRLSRALTDAAQKNEQARLALDRLLHS